MAKPAMSLDESLLDFALRKTPAVKEASLWDRTKDTGVDLARGVLGVPRGLAGLADLNGHPASQMGVAAFNAIAGKIKDPQAPLAYNPSLQYALNEDTPLKMDQWDDSLGGLFSEERQDEQATVSRAFDDGILPGLGSAVKNPAVAIGSVVQSLPGIAQGRAAGQAL